MAKLIANGIIEFENRPTIIGYAAVGSEDEKNGRFGNEFDMIFNDPMLGKESWEQAESELQKNAVRLAVKKAGKTPEEVDFLFGGDLLNQCAASTFGTMSFGLPFVGIYGACSTMALTSIMAATFVDSGVAKNAVAVTSSHFCSAERQFRLPLEYGGQRTPTAQWTATASGSVCIAQNASNIVIKRAAVGRVEDPAVTDANNMGAAMAPAAADTIKRFLTATNTSPSDYDNIFTGDLGMVGSELLYQLLEAEGINLRGYHNDCGLLLYDINKQDVHAGGSGCGCSASVLCTHILNSLSRGEYKKVLFCATGALLSATTAGQGENIPGIAHLIEIESTQN